MAYSTSPYARGRGESILRKAIETGDPELVTALLQVGIGRSHQPLSGRNKLRVNLLNLTVNEGNVEILNTLLKAGADVSNPPVKFYVRTALQRVV